jgi:2-oxoglutarate dehydrogenase E2 component (dihydrolipoamide succinyltransferase)
VTSIQMPQLGETIIEGTILKWLKQEGETIERDEPLFEISTDKVDTEVPSPVAGTVTKILVPEGETVAVGTELAEIDSGDGSAAASAPAADEPAADEAAGGESGGGESGGGESASEEDLAAEVPAVAASEPTPTAQAAQPAAPAAAAATTAPAMQDRGPRSQILSPLVRKLAAEHDLDLSSIAGTGTGGRITKHDVEAAIAAGPTGTGAAPQPAPGVTPVTPSAPSTPGQGEEIVRLTHIRKAIGEHMVASLATSARAWTMVEVNVDHLVKLRERVKESFFDRYGVKLTYLPMVTRAVSEALLSFPMVNAELRGDELVVRKFVNMGIAVSYDQGLIVPVVRNVDAMNVPGIARAIADLAARARSHQLKPDEVTGATFTITNPGPYGSLLSVPIINQPNAGILSLDSIQKRPVVIDDAIAIRSMVYLSMSWDHRVIDGELATRFLARVKQNLESWDFAEDLGV